MKNVVFIIRDGFDAKYIYSRIINLKKNIILLIYLSLVRRLLRKNLLECLKAE